MSDCIFCKIIDGTAPRHKLYEDEKVIAILDHRPVRPGHAMVIPKQHVDYFMNLPDDLSAHIIQIGNRLARKMMKVFGPQPLTVGHVIHGFIPHVHYHVIPLYDWDDIASGQYAKAENGTVIFDAKLLPVADNKDQEMMAAQLRME